MRMGKERKRYCLDCINGLAFYVATQTHCKVKCEVDGKLRGMRHQACKHYECD